MTRSLSRLVLIALAFSLSGCSLLRQLLAEAFQPPRVTFQSAQLSGVSLDGGTLEVVYAVDNPNALSVRVEQVEYALALDGKRIESGKPEAGIRIPADGRTQLRFPARLSFADFGSGKSSATWVATGAITLTSPTGTLRIPLEATGPLELPQPPTAAVGLPRLTGLTLTEATIALPLEVKNPNAFPLQFGFSGALSVAGAKVARVAEESLGEVAARDSRAVEVPLRINFAEAIGAAAAASTGQAPLAFDGALQSGSAKIPVKWTQVLPFAKLSFAGAEIGEVSFEGARVNLVFDAENPTDLPVELANVSYALFVDGKPAASVPKTVGPKLEPRSNTKVSFPVEFKFADVTTALATLFTRRDAKWRTEGSFTLPTPLGPMAVPMKSEGKLELPRLPEVKVGAPRISELSFTTATVEVPLEVTNPNAFALPLNGLQAAVSIAGGRVGGVSFGDQGSLAAGEKRQVSAPISFELIKFLGAASALRAGSATVALDGSLQTGSLAVPLKLSQTVRFTR